MKLCCRGRPVDHRKDTQILDAASRLFMQHGLQGTTMEQIAKDANVSKLTLYRRYPDKNRLFMDVISSKCAEYLPDDLFAPAAGDVRENLERLGTAFLTLTTSDGAVNLYRVIVAEAAQSLSTAQLFFYNGPNRMKEGTVKLMETLEKRGNLKVADPAFTAEVFMALFFGCDMDRERRLGLRPQPSPEEIKVYVVRAVAFFLKGCK